SPEIALPLEPLQIVLDSIQPALDIKALPQEPILLRFKGTPQCRAEYRLKNWKSKEWKNRWRPMFENSSSSGVYESFLTIPPPEEQNYTPETGGSVVFRLTNSIGKKVQAFSPGYFEILKPEDFVWYETQAEETVLRTGPGAGSEQMGYDLFLPKGVKLKQNGQIGKELRFHLSSAISGWTDLKNVKKIREPVSELRAVLESVKAKGLKRRTLLRCALSGKVPYRVHVSNDLKTVSVLFFKTLSNLDRIRYEDDLSLKTVGTIQWIQANEETVEILCDLKEKLWGYEARYEDDRFVLELIFSPPPIQNRQNPLSQLKVVVDPGHSLEMGDGAISPQGILEGEINYAIALRLKESLESMGSKVILTRRKNELVSLQERARRAKTERADLYISIHANALPDGANPFERHGFSVFYFHPFSFDFARSVHAAYKQRIPLSDDGLYYGNLAVCRIPQMPAILTESAYLIHPEEEELLSSEDFQRSLAQTITEGALDFLKSW
ncbi:MAG: N-acetylmuramoyl-L-alanine amidase, partial [Elusimicrobia bacterium]|nr:N-acetylmuramoyl-L-alanine amidase [Elusimicrobiota bacterium]